MLRKNYRIICRLGQSCVHIASLSNYFSVNGEVYHDFLQNTMWSSLRGSATRKQYWYLIMVQHDILQGHVYFLQSKFENRSLARNLEHK